MDFQKVLELLSVGSAVKSGGFHPLFSHSPKLPSFVSGAKSCLFELQLKFDKLGQKENPNPNGDHRWMGRFVPFYQTGGFLGYPVAIC